VKVESTLNARIAELEKAYAVDARHGISDANSERVKDLNSRNSSSEEISTGRKGEDCDEKKVEKMKEEMVGIEKKYSERIRELMTLLTIETNQKEYYKTQIEDLQTLQNAKMESDLYSLTTSTSILGNSEKLTPTRKQHLSRIIDLEDTSQTSETENSNLKSQMDIITTKNYEKFSGVESKSSEFISEEEILRNKILELENAKQNKISELNNKFSKMENDLKNQIMDNDKERTSKFEELKSQLNQLTIQDESLREKNKIAENSKDRRIMELELQSEILINKEISLQKKLVDLEILKNSKITKLESKITEIREEEKISENQRNVSDVIRADYILELEEQIKHYQSRIEDLESPDTDMPTGSGEV
jgi:DNA repair exonuclease SbcCD ATPase subunit